MNTSAEKIKRLEERLSVLKSAAAKAELAARFRASKAARAIDTRRKILIGAYVLDQLSNGPAALKLGDVSLLDWLTRHEDRLLFATELPAVGDLKQPASDLKIARLESKAAL